MAVRCGALEQKYVFEYEVGLWTFGKMQVRREKDSANLVLIRTVPKAGLSTTAGVMSKLRKLMELKHQHIVNITDVLEDKYNFFVISELCQGGDVQDWMERFIEGGYHMHEQTVASYLRQVLLALTHSHSSKIYHRDLRPSCLCLTSKMPDATVKVSDIGLAAIFDPENVALQNNQIRNRFTAPEVLIDGDLVYDSAPDMWSVGAMAQAMLVGKPPSQEEVDADEGLGQSIAALIGRVSGNTGKLNQAWKERSPEARDFVERLLQSTDERPTAAKMLQHPWLRSLTSPTVSSYKSDTDQVKDVRHKYLCYSLAVLLIPCMTPQRDFEQLRAAFEQTDADRDGYISRYIAQRLLVKRSMASQDVAKASVLIVDIGKTDVIDLCGMACADLIAREFFIRNPGSASFRAVDLSPRMVKRFFEVYGDRTQAGTTTAGMASKMRTTTAQGMQKYAGVSYEEILGSFASASAIDSQALVGTLCANEGLGTPLGTGAEDLSPITCSNHSTWACEPIGEALLTKFFRGCGLGGSRARAF